MAQEDSLPVLKLSTGWVAIEIVAEPTVQLTFKGYAPIIQVKALKTGLEYSMYISAKTLSEPLEGLRTANGGVFTGLRFEVRKAGMEKTAKYEVRPRSENDLT
jgi:hypothetical protein